MTNHAADLKLEDFQLQALEQLVLATDSPCLSILMPTHRSGRETRQGPIRLKNLLDQAREQFTSPDQVESLCGGLESLTEDHDFWQRQGRGLAVFADPQGVKLYRLGRRVHERVMVGKAFCVTPLLRRESSAGDFAVLSLTWDEAKLFRTVGSSLTLVDDEEWPARFDALVLPRDPETQLQYSSHSTSGSKGGQQRAMYHGHGQGEDKIDADRQQYLSLVGEHVENNLYGLDLPLVIAATDEVAGHFAAATDLEIRGKVIGSPTELAPEDLGASAREVLEGQLDAGDKAFGERFGTARAQSLGSADLTEIVTAATQGRVAELLVAEHAEVWGTVDGEAVVVHSRHAEAESIELVNQAVVETLRNGGDALQTDRASMPVDANVLAIYRY